MDRQQHIKLALSEDQYKKDITTKILQLDEKCKAIVKAKESFHNYEIAKSEQWLTLILELKPSLSQSAS